jgi:uncharacterized membrane protein
MADKGTIPFYDVTELVNAPDSQLPDFMKGDGGKKRIEALDETRGLCVLLMIVYHGLYLLGLYFDVEWAASAQEKLFVFQPAVAALFILISGVCARLSRDVAKRGFQLLAIALAISVLTIGILPLAGIDKTPIWFGVLHMLSCSMLLFHVGRKVFDLVPAVVGALLCLFLFVFTARVEQGYLGLFGQFQLALPAWLDDIFILFPFGFYNNSFVSADYFPLLPYAFMFLFGTFLGKFAAKGQVPQWCYKRHFLFLGWFGKHALLCYVLHLPLLYGIFYLFQTLGA